MTILAAGLALGACGEERALHKFIPLCPVVPPRALPSAWSTSFMPLGDSHTSGFQALGAQPGGIALGIGADGTGTWRRHLLDRVSALGIPIPQASWMRGTAQSTDPNIPPGQNHHQGLAGYRCLDLSHKFADYWAPGFAAQSIVLMCGTNDWQTWLNVHPGDYEGAAAEAQANLATLLATIRDVAGPEVTVGVVTPPTGLKHLPEATLFVPRVRATIADAAASGQRVRLLCDATTYLRPIPPGTYDLPPLGFMDADDVHLNEIGQRVLADCILHGMLEESCDDARSLSLPSAWATSFMPLGDSQTSGAPELGAQPEGITLSDGADGTGTWRRHLHDAVSSFGVSVPEAWMRGAEQSTDPHLPPAQSHHQGVPGARCDDLDANFASYWTGDAVAQSIVLMCATNDWRAWLDTHPDDHAGAASYAQANLASLLATIKAVAGPDVVVGVVSPPTGQKYRAAANQFLPLLNDAIADAAARGQKVYLLCDGTTRLQPTPPGSVGFPPAGFMADDDIYLNEIGQRALAGCILNGMLQVGEP